MLKKRGRRERRDGSGHGLSGSSSRLDPPPARDGRRVPNRVSLLGAVVLLGPLALLGEWLIEKTHHRPLGAATFASVTVLLWLAFELSSRVLFSARRLRPRTVERAKRIVAGVGIISSAVVFGRALL